MQVLNWKVYYQSALRSLSGYTKTFSDPSIVRGWKVRKPAQGVPEVLWKDHPESQKEWLGESGYPNSPGFIVLKHATQGKPKPVKKLRMRASTKKKRLDGLRGNNMVTTMQKEGLVESSLYNIRCIDEEKIIHKFIEDKAPQYEWGRLCEVGGKDGMKGPLRVVEKFFLGESDERSDMWELPEGPNDEKREATENIHHFSNDIEFLTNRHLPLVRYRNQTARNCAMAEHPNNEAHPALLQERGNGNLRREEQDLLVELDVDWEKRNQDGTDSTDSDNWENQELEESGPEFENVSESDVNEDHGDNDSPSPAPAENSLPAPAALVDNDCNQADPVNSSLLVRTIPDAQKNLENTAASSGAERYYVYVPWEKCKVGSMCVGVVRYVDDDKNPVGQGLYAGKIISKNDDEKTFKIEELLCTRDRWLEACVRAKWFKRNGKQHVSTKEYWSVIQYFNKFLAKGNFPKLTQEKILEKKVQWGDP